MGIFNPTSKKNSKNREESAAKAIDNNSQETIPEAPNKTIYDQEDDSQQEISQWEPEALLDTENKIPAEPRFTEETDDHLPQIEEPQHVRDNQAEADNTKYEDTSAIVGEVAASSETVSPQSVSTDQFEDRFNDLEKRMIRLAESFEDKIQYDEHKETVINNLHSELQGYREENTKKQLIPMMMDIIQTIDQTNKISKSIERDTEVTAEKLIRIIKDSALDLEDILYKQGIDSYSSENEEFNSMKQKVIKTVKTSDKTLDKKLAARLGKGYEWEGRIIRKEQVAVYVFSDKE